MSSPSRALPLLVVVGAGLLGAVWMALATDAGPQPPAAVVSKVRVELPPVRNEGPLPPRTVARPRAVAQADPPEQEPAALSEHAPVEQVAPRAVRCPVELPSADPEARWPTINSDIRSRSDFGRITDDGHLEALVHRIDAIEVRVRGFEPARAGLVEAIDGTLACDQPLVFEPYGGQLTVTVTGGVDGALVVVEGCDEQRRSHPLRDRRSVTWSAPTGPCEVRALQRHGNLSWPGPWVPVEVGADTEVTLDLPDWAPAGLGIRIGAEERGIRVTGVLPDSPAERAGLQDGDLVVAIDDESTEGMDVDAFLTWGLGREGTIASVQVERRGEITEVEVKRAHIGSGER